MSARPQPVAARGGEASPEWARRLEEKLDRILAHLDRRPAPDAQGEILLQAIADHAGHRVFTVAELIRHAALESSAGLREAIGVRNARQLGRLLRRLEGRQLAGLVLHREGEDRGGLVWRVSRVSNPHNSWISAIG